MLPFWLPAAEGRAAFAGVTQVLAHTKVLTIPGEVCGREQQGPSQPPEIQETLGGGRSNPGLCWFQCWFLVPVLVFGPSSYFLVPVLVLVPVVFVFAVREGAR